jgi:hypothetical protein
VSDHPKNLTFMTVPTSPPFSFGVGTQGDLIIGWSAGELPDGTTLHLHLTIPADELPSLVRGLGILSGDPPMQSSH